MVDADAARTAAAPSIVPEADQFAARSVEAIIDTIEQIHLVILEEPTSCIRAKISHLDHEGELTVDEQRRLDDAVDDGILRAVAMISAGQCGEPLCRGIVLILYDNADRHAETREQVMVPRDHLLEGKIENLVVTSAWVVRRLPLCVREESGVPPATDGVASIIRSHLPQSPYALLLRVTARHPRCVDLAIQVVTVQDSLDFLVLRLPALSWYREAEQHEVRRRAGPFDVSGLVEVADVHSKKKASGAGPERPRRRR